MRPAPPGPASSHVTSDLRLASSLCFASSRCSGLCPTAVPSTSLALGANLVDETRSEASLWSRMYCSSGAGKAGDSGTAIDRAARAASNVTFQTLVKNVRRLARCAERLKPPQKTQNTGSRFLQSRRHALGIFFLHSSCAHLYNRSYSQPGTRSSPRPGPCHPSPPSAGPSRALHPRAARRR